MSNSKLNRIRETRSCSVPTCKNKRVGRKDDSGPSFHRFPKDPAIRKAWIEHCKIESSFNPDHGSVCSEHFDFDDFERSYQKQLMGIERRPMLKKNVVPHLNLPMSRISNCYRGGLRNNIRSRFQNLIQINKSNSNMSKKEPKIETINVSLKEEHADAIIVDYESDLESLCVQSVEDNVDPLSTDHAMIENISIETDYKALYRETIQKYEKLKSHVAQVESDLAKEKKRADNYQNMLTKIFADGEMHLVYRKKS